MKHSVILTIHWNLWNKRFC